ncbi:HNH endonuclease [Caldibacillus thermoamylovorans]|uniref:HNH endonuclease n=1 Tax=Caldibacillus thermoamylovorans TaxID=35841 RepID=UPI001D07BAF9|nr:HNH endonuclease signature motif containing protein [Caldibacillus thermoamylovorans]MCB5934483.1 HNH endonuclease [Bacillus sp. DFI.2.34]MCB7076458.1 HNH endonuclease [Caldibacillus thermoamylovorans]
MLNVVRILQEEKKKYCSDECFKEKRRRDNRERMRKANPPKPDVTIKCEWCGKDFTVPSRNAHQARFCSDKCRDTWWSRVVYKHKPIEEQNTERRKQKLIRQKRLEKERLERVVTKECVWCGDTFETTNIRPLTCSSECSRKRKNRIKWERKETRLNEKNTLDTDITLMKLYKRDKGKCHICNELCDYGDKQITSEGYFIAGETYPSIDHVIPIAKGGKHSWDNVKLAHHRCNGIKNDRIIRENKALV